jgi:hypothetical protein
VYSFHEARESREKLSIVSGLAEEVCAAAFQAGSDAVEFVKILEQALRTYNELHNRQARRHS